MDYQGIVIGAIAFLIIGVFHPIVTKGEYYFGVRIWPLFLIAGITLIAASLFTTSTIASAALGITGFASLWSIHELFHQVERVKKGWFPRNPNRPEGK